MYQTQLPFVELFRSVTEYGDGDLYTDVLAPWVASNEPTCQWIRDFREKTDGDWALAEVEDLCRLYALFRVTSALIDRVFSGGSSACRYDAPDRRITREGFEMFHESLGFRPTNETVFHPFYCEVVEVEEAVPGDTKPMINEVHWPGLMLGSLMFSRAGCSLRAGHEHVRKSIADSSRLYWTYRRAGRECEDLSHGWGGNSQWRTPHRRDYRTAGRFFYNVDGECSLDEADCDTEGVSPDTMIELIRYRQLVRSSSENTDLYPYRFTYSEDR